MRSPRRFSPFLGPLFLAGLLGCQAEPPEATAPRVPPPGAWRVQPVSNAAVKLVDDFWRPRLEKNRTVTIPHIMGQNEQTGRVANFRRAAGLEEGAFEGRAFNDTDVYKVIEAASYALIQQRDPDLEARIDERIELIAAAQEDDGYLYPARTADPQNTPAGAGRERWIHVHGNSHELYAAGHLIEAAVAYHEATGKRSLLDVAIRFADLIDAEFGPDARRDVPGHEEIELALVKLADITGDRRYLDLAAFFLEERGKPHDGEDYPADNWLAKYDVPIYRQDHIPLREQREAAGHSVRAMYLYTGMTDVAARAEMPGYAEALDALWTDVVSSKLYLTGGIGARGSFESFGEPYELPNETAYAEACAAIGQDMWNHRLFLASGDGRYLDVMERILYNGILSGVSEEGDTFFYTNPLQSSGDYERKAYYEVACCPANLARLIGQLPGFVYAQQDDVVCVNLFVGSEADVELADVRVHLVQETRYPWDGAVRLAVEPSEGSEFELRVRIPGWARERPVPSDLYQYLAPASESPVLRVNGDVVPLQLDSGFAVVSRTWNQGDVVELALPMPPRRVVAHEKVEEDAGKRAIQRGPLVYAVEAVDHGGRVLDLELPEDAELSVGFEPDLLGGVATVTGTALRAGESVPMRAIPYFAWGNRGTGEMAVWLPGSS